MSHFRHCHRGAHPLMWNRLLMGHGKKTLNCGWKSDLWNWRHWQLHSICWGTVTAQYMLYWVPCSIGLELNCEQVAGARWKNQPHKNRRVHKYVALKPCHLRVCLCLSAICCCAGEVCTPWFMFAWPRLAWNTPYLRESHYVIRQHTDTAIGIIDKVLNPQWAAAMCGWDGCEWGCWCWNGRTRVQSPHYDANKSAWCNSQWMTHLCWSQRVGASLLAYWLKEAGKVH